MRIDGKCGNVDAKLIVLIVPSKNSIVPTMQTQRGRSCGYLSHTRNTGLSNRRCSLRRGEFAVERQLVQHVAERLEVHQPMLDGHLKQSAMFKDGEARIIRHRVLKLAVQRLAQPSAVFANMFPRGPIARLVRGQFAIHGIDAKRT